MSPVLLKLLAGVVALSMLAGCRVSRPPAQPVGVAGRWYVVQEGETLSDIARRAGVPEEDLLEVNGWRSAADARPGRSIFVLEVAPSGGAQPSSPSSPSSPASALTGTAADGRRGGGADARQLSTFRWPVEEPRVTSLFGTRWGRPHEGIDLTAPIGTPVLAAGSGEVIYAGNAVRGYGNMVVVKHEAELMTVYAHNSVLFVKVGDRVRIGQRVALSGQSGHATGPHVHFEVRKSHVPRDPLPYLPEIRTTRIVRERTPKS